MTCLPWSHSWPGLLAYLCCNFMFSSLDWSPSIWKALRGCLVVFIPGLSVNGARATFYQKTVIELHVRCVRHWCLHSSSTSFSFSLKIPSFSMCLCLLVSGVRQSDSNMYICICMCVYVYIYIYTHTHIYMLLNCDIGEDPWESLALQGDPTNPSYRKSVLNIHWKDWGWSWNSNTLATWCKELTPWKRPLCWERLKVGGERDDRGWHGWMASPTQWT